MLVRNDRDIIVSDMGMQMCSQMIFVVKAIGDKVMW